MQFVSSGVNTVITQTIVPTPMKAGGLDSNQRANSDGPPDQNIGCTENKDQKLRTALFEVLKHMQFVSC